MTTAPSAALLILLEKVAVDNGFDQPLGAESGWLAFASTQAPLRLWLSRAAEGQLLAAFSRWDVANSLADRGELATPALPPAALAARAVPDLASLHHLVRRAFQLARTLPHQLLHDYEKQTAKLDLPTTTEVERLVKQRVGHDIFRRGLLEYWEGRCAVTGLAVPELLRASHIKPWASCESDAERLDVFNGLLLAPHLDAAFDGGYISFEDSGGVLIGETLAAPDRRQLCLDDAFCLRVITASHRHYLSWHRQHLFRHSPGASSPAA